ncbi:hypothetical protein [Vagococcus silagei]|uniref:Uncharacterized protein n=1 Tax=Vagococcus silagei TaxID=2508885 RepID=A0A4S3B8C5_9ENTE|nr:hypothetical protein [Vagococcus silagei]THB62390.1 hypothetical protein ESZ54_00835 [Vagococcus silagei]
MKFIKSIILSVVVLFSLSACGMTQELDQAIDSTTAITTDLKAQKKDVAKLEELTRKVKDTLDKDLADQSDDTFYQNEEGFLYKNVQKRNEILTTLVDHKKLVKKQRKEIDTIVSKKAVDVDNKKLRLIASSLTIIENNYEALILYLTTGLEQEDDLYNALPLDDLATRMSVIERNNGSITMLSEETLSNIDYTLDLIETFQKNAKLTKTK